MTINNRIKYACYTTRNLKYPDNKEIQGRRREKTLLDWILIIGTIALVIILFWFIPRFFVSGAKAATPDLCGLTVVECSGEQPIPIKHVRYIEAYETYYTKEECTNKDCMAANGKRAQEGGIACPRNIRLGTQIWIGEEIYTCADRYSTRLDSIRNLPTFDVYTSNDSAWAREQGIKKVIVGIVE